MYPCRYISRNCLTLEGSSDQEIVNVYCFKCSTSLILTLTFLAGLLIQIKGRKRPVGNLLGCHTEATLHIIQMRLTRYIHYSPTSVVIYFTKVQHCKLFLIFAPKTFCHLFSGTGQRGRVWWWWRRHDCFTTLQVSTKFHAVIQNQVH